MRSGVPSDRRGPRCQPAKWSPCYRRILQIFWPWQVTPTPTLTDVHHHTFAQTCRMYSTKSEPRCKLWTLVAITCQCRRCHRCAALVWGLSTALHGRWGDGEFQGLSLFSIPLCCEPNMVPKNKIYLKRKKYSKCRLLWASQVAWMVKKQCRSSIPEFDPGVGTVSCRRGWRPTPVFLPQESRGERSLVGYSPWGRKELDTTEQLTPPPYTHKCTKGTFKKRTQTSS